MQKILMATKKVVLNRFNKMINILPGLSICVIIAMIAKMIGNYLTGIGGASIAIFIGMAVGNTFGNNRRYALGTKFAESDLLSYSIVLLGGTLSVQTLMKLGVSGVVYIMLQMIITIGFAIVLGKKLGFSENYGFLMASGNAVCGSSAIAATAPVIGADENEKGIAITIVNVTGTVLMLVLPFLASIIYASETIKTSAFIGGILQSVGQVVASGSLVSEDVKDLSTIFKIVRIIFLIFVVLSFGAIKRRSNRSKEQTLNAKAKAPWYVIGFFIMCALFTTGIISSQVSQIFKVISNNFEVIALAGIGMRVNFRELIKQGARVSVYALGIATMQIISAILLIWIMKI
jgi:uncharacterized integral membrane protein (TIGR00698 family)